MARGLQGSYKDRWLLRDGSKRQQSLIAWAKEHNFIKLRSITAVALDQWRDTWVFRPNSFSQKVHCGVIAAFFEWAVTFEYLSRNPFDKLDKIHVKEIPTPPLEPEQVTALLAHTDACGKHSATMGVLILLMRWSGLAVRDAGCLQRNALGTDNHLRTYRQKSGEFVYVKLPSLVADALRNQTCSDPKYFFWDPKRRSGKSQAQKFDLRFQAIFKAAGIAPCSAHRLRDTFAVRKPERRDGARGSVEVVGAFKHQDNRAALSPVGEKPSGETRYRSGSLVGCTGNRRNTSTSRVTRPVTHNLVFRRQTDIGKSRARCGNRSLRQGHRQRAVRWAFFRTTD